MPSYKIVSNLSHLQLQQFLHLAGSYIILMSSPLPNLVDLREYIWQITDIGLVPITYSLQNVIVMLFKVHSIVLANVGSLSWKPCIIHYLPVKILLCL